MHLLISWVLWALMGCWAGRFGNFGVVYFDSGFCRCFVLVWYELSCGLDGIVCRFILVFGFCDFMFADFGIV